MEFLGDFFQVVGLAFPYNKDFPTRLAQIFEISFIAINISTAFVLPEFCMRGGFNASITATVHMPETAVNQNNFAMFRQHQVRLPGQIPPMKSVAITHAVDETPNDKLRSCVL